MTGSEATELPKKFEFATLLDPLARLGSALVAGGPDGPPYLGIELNVPPTDLYINTVYEKKPMFVEPRQLIAETIGKLETISAYFVEEIDARVSTTRQLPVEALAAKEHCRPSRSSYRS